MFRNIVTAILLLTANTNIYAQKDWIAPEGKIINYRTLTWDDFLGRPDPNADDVNSFIVPALYYIADSGDQLPSGRVTFKFTVKCAFQSQSWVRGRTEHALIHQQGCYDITLLYANMLKMQLSSRDYSEKNYAKEMEEIHDGLYKRMDKSIDDYEGGTDTGKNIGTQPLWDMRIKKCLENTTDEYMASPESAVAAVAGLGQLVKRLPQEPARLFATRCRPYHAWYTEEMGTKTLETTEWTTDPAVIAFYTLNYASFSSEIKFKENKKILACAYMPTAKGIYKRVYIDNYTNEGNPVNLVGAFFANADSDKTKELVIITSITVKDAQSSGTQYMINIYDNTPPHAMPPKLTPLDIGKKLGGLAGTQNGKAVMPKCKNEKEVKEALKKMGYEQ